jgi:hypothetical protein
MLLNHIIIIIKWTTGQIEVYFNYIILHHDIGNITWLITILETDDCSSLYDLNFTDRHIFCSQQSSFEGLHVEYHTIH